MNTPRTTLLSLALLAALAHPVAAQDAAGTAVTQPENATLTLAFPGGSLAEFLEAVRERTNGANIIASPAAEEIEVPPIHLTGAPVGSALQAVSRICSSHIVEVKAQYDPSGRTVYALRITARMPGGPAAQVAQGSKKKVRTRVEVFSLGSFTDSIDGQRASPDTILTAIDTGLKILADDYRSELRYHEESGLLFLKGTPEQIDVVRQVLAGIKNDLERSRTAARQAVAEKRRGRVSSPGEEPEEPEAPAKTKRRAR